MGRERTLPDRPQNHQAGENSRKGLCNSSIRDRNEGKQWVSPAVRSPYMAFCNLLPLVRSHVLDRPCLQKRHSPQAIWKEATTRSPCFKLVTPEATLSTIPQNSCPETRHWSRFKYRISSSWENSTHPEYPRLAFAPLRRDRDVGHSHKWSIQ